MQILWIPVGIAVLFVSWIVGQKMFARYGDNSGDEKTTKEKTDHFSEMIEGFRVWVNAWRNHPIAFAVYVIGGWWILVSIGKSLEQEYPPVWKFLWDDHFLLTLWTPIYILPSVFLFKAQSRVIKSFGTAIVTAVSLYWIFILGDATANRVASYYAEQSIVDDSPKTSPISQSITRSDVLTPITLTATPEKWTDPVVIPRGKQFNFIFPEYEDVTTKTILVKVRVNRTREFDDGPNVNANYGQFVQLLEFRSVGEKDVQVNVFLH